MSLCTTAQCLVSRSALLSNFSLIHALAAGRAIGLVIKGNGYGHGALQIAELFDADTRVAYFLTAGLREGVALRAAGINKPIMAMAYCDGDIREAVACGVEPSIATDAELFLVHSAARALKKNIVVHIKVDTGIARRGVAWYDVGPFYKRAAALENITVKTIFTHCADSSPEDTRFIYEQQHRYEQALHAARTEGFLGMAHMASSGSLTLIPGYDMVRVGTMLYGSWKNEIQKKRIFSVISDAELISALTLRVGVFMHDEATLVVYGGYRDAYCIVRGATLFLSCGCKSSLTDVSETVSYAPLVCHHTVEYADLVGARPGILPTDVALCRGTIANEITTRIYQHVPRIY